MQLLSLAKIDINMLLALDVLLEEESVTKAAKRLHVTQPAMSQTLKRLRALFDDPLLLRVGGRMKRTAKGEHLRGPLRAALGQLAGIIDEQPSFIPEKANHTFRIAALDYTIAAIMPELVSRLHAIAPQLSIEIHSISPGRTFGALESGDVDLGIGVFPPAPSHMSRQLLFQETFLSLVCNRHPLLQQMRDIPKDRQQIFEQIKTFASYPHGLVITTGEGEGAVDRILREEYDLARQVTVKIPYFLAAGHLLPSTELIFTMPSRAVRRMAAYPDLASFVPPIELPTFPVDMVWPKRLENSPAHVWLRAWVLDVCHEEDEGASGDV